VRVGDGLLLTTATGEVDERRWSRSSLDGVAALEARSEIAGVLQLILQPASFAATNPR
jgi:hypothetical protein